MTKKDYEGVAAVLRKSLEHRRNVHDEHGASVVVNLARNLADHFEDLNVRFRRDLFLRAALGEVGGPVND